MIEAIEIEIVKKDWRGRITQLGRYDTVTMRGKSVCHSCGKTMKVCWDAWCNLCEHVFCYDCIVDIDGNWYCKKCSGRDTL